ncbi:RNA 3'-terminal phosphate cyclase [Microbulbifer aggregans]|uniref:RNA 3'-terminal phosphate cyclase n=1 Tax=Microbulbifer aggregans TaxID=1769779 RepID=A0A1C9W715_9GAMM|nr:RNA 3'-terminal phosphate cyclase [Microbulbifer aggregans]AOS96941.1 RNA 3'-terminal phosphate cyclase [Microbulbifer aggregans]
MNWLAIDGSYGEGGGQLSRYAVALAAISGRSLHLKNIRAGRAKPGLMAQHLAALRAVAEVCGGVLEGAELGAQEVYFRPGPIRGGEYHFDVGTAGSVVLVLQALLPVALKADSAVQLSMAGGTDVRMAPPVDYLTRVFLPWLARMGVRVQIESIRHGYYPRGGGRVNLRVQPCRSLLPLTADMPGALQRIAGVSHVAHLPSHIAERMAKSAREVLEGLGPIQVEEQVLTDVEAFGSGGALVLVAETENSQLGAAAVAERGIPAERLGEEAGRALLAELEAGAAVDVHACDQLLLYAAMAAESSRLAVREVSRHAQTVMWLVEQFLPTRFTVTPCGSLFHIDVHPG